MKTKGQTKNTEDERTSDEGHPIATNLKSSRFQHCSLARDEPQIGFVCLFVLYVTVCIHCVLQVYLGWPIHHFLLLLYLRQNLYGILSALIQLDWLTSMLVFYMGAEDQTQVMTFGRQTFY